MSVNCNTLQYTLDSRLYTSFSALSLPYPFRCHRMMAAANFFTNSTTGEVWIVDRALLEVKGAKHNIVLLVRDSMVPNATDTRYRVVFNKLFVSGDWYVHTAQNGVVEHIMIKFHYTGADRKAKWHMYSPVAGTLAWMRATDHRIFLEIVDLPAAQDAAGIHTVPVSPAPTGTGNGLAVLD